MLSAYNFNVWSTKLRENESLAVQATVKITNREGNVSELNNLMILSVRSIWQTTRDKVAVFILALGLTGCEKPTPPVESVRHAAVGLFDASISRDGRFAVVASVNHGAAYWDLSENKLLFQWNHGSSEDSIYTTAIAPDNRVAATADSKSFVLWDTQTGKSKGFWEVENKIRDIALANNGRHLALALRGQRILYINMGTGRRLEMSGHVDVVNSVSLSANGRYLLSGANDYRAIFWDLKQVKPIFIWEHKNRVTLVALSDNGEYAFSSGVSSDAYIWKLKTGDRHVRLAQQKREYSFSAATFSRDARYLLTGSAGRHLILWDVETGLALDRWVVSKRDVGKPTGAIVYGLGFSEDNLHVLSESSSGFGEKWLIEKKLEKPVKQETKR